MEAGVVSPSPTVVSIFDAVGNGPMIVAAAVLVFRCLFGSSPE